MNCTNRWTLTSLAGRVELPNQLLDLLLYFVRKLFEEVVGGHVFGEALLEALGISLDS